jgi:hypothetical protein
MKKGKTNRMILELDRNELHGDDCTVAVVRALRACAEQGIRVLRFPKGTYRFRPEKAYEQHYFITNHDQGGTRKTAFPIISLQGLTIDGAGSEFLFEGPMIPFVIEGSSDVTLRDMMIDWVRPMFEQGVVVEAADDSFLVRLAAGVPYKAVDGRLFFEFGGRMEPVWGLHDIDPATKAHAYQSGDRISWSSFRRLRIDEVEPRLFRVSGELRHVPMIGHIVTMRFGRRENPGIFLKDSAGVRIENVTLHHAPGMGLVAQRCADIRLDRFDVRLREGSERVVTATADATHFTGCRGPIIVERCLFENQLDDPLNVHGIYARIVERVSDRVLLVKLIHDMQKGVDIAGPGDTLQFVRCDSLLGYGQAVVESAVRLNGDYAAITFSEPLPDSIVLQDVVENVTWCPDLTIRECTVRANRARGFLITTPGSVLVEDNRISAPGAGIKISGDANSWFESGAVRDVTIRRNVFGDCNSIPRSKARKRIRHATIGISALRTTCSRRSIRRLCTVIRSTGLFFRGTVSERVGRIRAITGARTW